MSEVSPEAPVASKFDPEAFAMNLAKAMESGGQALAAYLKPRENGDARDKPPNEIGEVVKTFSAVAEYWLSDNQRSTDLQAPERARSRRRSHEDSAISISTPAQCIALLRGRLCAMASRLMIRHVLANWRLCRRSS